MWQVQVRDSKTRELDENIGEPTTLRAAQQVKRGVEINLDHGSYYVWLQRIPDDNGETDKAG